MKTLLTLFAICISFTSYAQTEICCINPDWVNPEVNCTEVYDPVIGCDDKMYSNACVAQAAGVTSWEDSAGEIIEQTGIAPPFRSFVKRLRES